MSNDHPDNWLLTIAYDGSSYFGWQVQPQQQTIQGHLQNRLSALFRTDIRIHGCSRTDAGVHAIGQCASMALPSKPVIAEDNVLRALNHSLPADIRILSIRLMPAGFHARHNAVGKAYTYVVHTGPLSSPFLPRLCYSMSKKTDIDRMQSAASRLLGKHDFTSFSVHSGSNDTDCVKTLRELRIRETGEFIVISCIGDSFLYRMVRRLVGFLITVGVGRIDPSRTAEILAARTRNAGFDTAPPQGLYLEKIFYDDQTMTSYESPCLPFLQLVDVQ